MMSALDSIRPSGCFLRISGRQNGGGNAIGIDQWDFQLWCEPFVPECCFAAAVVAGQNKRGGLALAGDCLR